MSHRIWTRGVRRLRRVRDDRGAILIIAIIIVTFIAVVVGALLTRGDGSLRATIQLRSVAGTTYAADGAAQVAINGLRTGMRDGAQEPNLWTYTNEDISGSVPAKIEGCFGWSGSAPTVTPDPDLLLSNFYPPSKSSGQGWTSAYVTCEAESDTGAQGPLVPINDDNKPGYAVVTLGGPLTSSGPLNISGGVYSNSNITGPVNLLAGGAYAVGTCPNTTATPKDCSPTNTPIGDPGVNGDGTPKPEYNPDVTSVPALQKPPTSCPGGVAAFEPGYYDNAAALTTATNLCSVAWFKPGAYYFDFHNDGCANVCPNNIFGTGENQWNINANQTVIGGTRTGGTTMPGSCVSPITDVSAVGVQFVFGGTSRLFIDKDANVELCASYHPDRPPIVIYGLKTGSTPAAGPPENGRLATSIGPVGNFTGATVPNLAAADGDQATNANLAVWARNNSGANNLTSSLTVSGFVPANAIPKGAVLTAATLRVTHRSTGNQNAMTLTPNLGTGPITYTLPVKANLGLETVDLTTKSGWGNFQKAVHDEGFTGASFKFDASLGKNQTSQLDAVSLDLTYYAPVLRGQAGTCVATGISCPLIDMKNGNNKIVFYLQGTTYAPLSYFSILLGNFSAEVAKFGIVARQLSFTSTNGNPDYTGPVFEIPANSPGFGVKSTVVHLKVWVCPGVSTCSASGTPDLTSRVQLWDPTGATVKNQRATRILSWSHNR